MYIQQNIVTYQMNEITNKGDVILTCLSSRPKPDLLIIQSCDDSAMANNFESTLAAPTWIVCRKHLIFRHEIGQSVNFCVFG